MSETAEAPARVGRPRKIHTPGAEAADKLEPVALAPEQPVAKADGELPEASEVDPRRIRRAVLTKQGWVCPIELPTPGNRE